MAASERLDLLGTSNHSGSAVTAAKTSSKDGGILSVEAMQLANKMGMVPSLQRLKQLRQMGATDLQSKLELQICKQDLTESTLIASQELRTVVARIDSELADASEIHAHLAERRDKAVRFNTYANLVSGGITGIVGGAFQTSDLHHLTYDLIDTTEGVVQTCIAGWAFKQQSGEKRIESGSPNLLRHLMDRSPDTESDYPPSVWSYMNLPARVGKGTIMSSLVDRWFTLHLCLKHNGHREKAKTRMQKISNSLDARVTIDILEDRMAMLTDLRACVHQMDYLILELLQFIRGTKSLPD